MSSKLIGLPSYCMFTLRRFGYGVLLQYVYNSKINHIEAIIRLPSGEVITEYATSVELLDITEEEFKRLTGG